MNIMVATSNEWLNDACDTLRRLYDVIEVKCL